MALDLSTIDQNVNDNLTKQSPTNDNTLPVAEPPAAPPNGDDDLRSQLAEATAKIAAMQADRDREATEREAAVAAERLKVASGIAKAPSAKVGCTEQDMALDRAINKVGGRAFWAKLTPAQQAEALGIQGADTSDKVVRQYFGKSSDSAAANRLANTNQAEYKRLRGLAKLRGIL
jgi:hypothetical protein